MALLDFDVHHGNGTEACMGRLLPQTLTYGLKTPLCNGQLNFRSFSPWLDFDDKDNFFFARCCSAAYLLLQAWTCDTIHQQDNQKLLADIKHTL